MLEQPAADLLFLDRGLRLLAVKAKPSGKKRGPCRRPDEARAPARTAPRFWACDSPAPLIAAWLVGFMRTRQPRKEQAMKQDIYQKAASGRGTIPSNAETILFEFALMKLVIAFSCRSALPCRSCSRSWNQ